MSWEVTNDMMANDNPEYMLAISVFNEKGDAIAQFES